MFKLLGLGQAPSAPALDPTDEVSPIHWFDGGYSMRSLVVYVFMAFDDVLDPEKIQDAFGRVVARGGYRKLGARLRKNPETGVIEHHIPRVFTPDRPPVFFHHEHHDMAAAKHPAGSKIPAPSEGLPAVVGDPEDLAEIMRCGSDGRPLVLDDYLLADRPVTGVNVVTFRDRTCLALHWVHSTFDIMGVSALMSAVVLALEDRDDEIPEPHGYTTDPLAELGMHATEKHVLADRALGIPGKLAYLGRNAYALAGPRETRTVCIPAPFWQKMVADVREELALQAKEAEGSDAPAPFVSEGDVLSAWFVRLLTASNLGRGSGATLAAHNSMSIRGVLENDLLPPGRPLLSNALTYPTILHPAREICGRPLSWLAREFRRAIVEQASRSQVEAYAAMQRELDPFMRMPVLCGDSSIYVLFLTNWQKARLFDLDFSAAAARPRPESKPVRASYVHGSQDPCYLDAWPISGKDADGNYWISGCRSKGLWGRFETELAKQNSGEVPL